MPKTTRDARGREIHLYDDSNWQELLTPPFGRMMGARPIEEHPVYRDYAAVPYTEYVEDFPLIPRSEWDSRIEEMDAKDMWPTDHFRFDSFDQDGLGYCWINCVAQAMTLCRDMQGHPHRRISSASMGGPIKNYRNQGGWPEDGVDYAIEHGAVDQNHWGNNALNRSLYNPTLDHRKHYKVTKAYKCSRESFDEAATCAFRCHGGIGSFNWWGHAVMYGVRVVKLGRSDYGIELRNSWGEGWGSKNKHGVGGFSVLEGRKSLPSDMIVVAQVTPSVGVPA